MTTQGSHRLANDAFVRGGDAHEGMEVRKAALSVLTIEAVVAAGLAGLAGAHYWSNSTGIALAIITFFAVMIISRMKWYGLIFGAIVALASGVTSGILVAQVGNGFLGVVVGLAVVLIVCVVHLNLFATSEAR